ncbi:UNVERIFIED_CONTAM: fumarate hydratase, partial [Streptococcus suis]
MKILVVGSGGREHALAWAIAKSPRIQTVYVAPGNGGTALDERLQNIAITDPVALADFVEQEHVALTVVGPEGPLAAGIVNVFLQIGMGVRFEGFSGSIADAVNEGVRRGYSHPDNVLRASIVADPQFERKNTKDNTPAVIHMELVPGNTVDVQIAAKGGGSENKTKFVMLNPSDNLVDWVLKTVPTMGAGWCPPGMLGIGIGGTAEKAMLMAKQVLMEDIDMYELLKRGPQNKTEELRIELYEKVNALGIGAQGLGGLTTVLDVKIMMHPTHAASKPVAMIPNCAATRHGHFVLDGSGPAYMEPPSLSDWPEVHWVADTEKSKRVNLDTLTKEEVASWKPGQTLLLNGKMLTGR